MVFGPKSQDSGKQQKDWEGNEIRLDQVGGRTDTEEVRKLIIPVGVSVARLDEGNTKVSPQSEGNLRAKEIYLSSLVRPTKAES